MVLDNRTEYPRQTQGLRPLVRLRPAATVQIDGNWYSLAKHIVCARGVELAVTRQSLRPSRSKSCWPRTRREAGDESRTGQTYRTSCAPLLVASAATEPKGATIFLDAVPLRRCKSTSRAKYDH